jgi:hypothetical protein
VWQKYKGREEKEGEREVSRDDWHTEEKNVKNRSWDLDSIMPSLDSLSLLSACVGKHEGRYRMDARIIAMPDVRKMIDK